jgi:hypothetical protein
LGKPVTFNLTGGHVHDSQQFATLMGTGWIRRLGHGRPRLNPDRVAGDKAYSSGLIRSALAGSTRARAKPSPSLEQDQTANLQFGLSQWKVRESNGKQSAGHRLVSGVGPSYHFRDRQYWIIFFMTKGPSFPVFPPI